MSGIEKMYTAQGSPIKTSFKKRFIKLKECKAYVKKIGLKLGKGKVAECFYKSLVTDIDPIRTQKMK